jgi:DNA-binding GntR family transcriptional regulator
MLQNINLRTLREHTYRAIKELILKNLLLPGHCITIRRLAEDLGISETPVREALVMLKAEGLVDYEPHKKPQITDITEDEVRQVYEVRKLIEPYTVSLVIEAFSKAPELKKKIEELEGLARKLMETPYELCDYQEYVEIDLKLNELFFRATENRIFREVFTLVSNRSMRIRTFVEATSKVKGSSLMHEITQEHQAIIQAMLREDREEAQRRVREHLANAESRTLREMKSYIENLRILQENRAPRGTRSIPRSIDVSWVAVASINIILLEDLSRSLPLLIPIACFFWVQAC